MGQTRKFTFRAAMGACLIALGALALAQNSQDELAAGFRQPPDSAKPRTWWHWTNSNVTKEGITKDLEWMKRAGIGGFQLADVSAGSGQVVEKKIVYGTPEWLDAVRHASAEAQRLGLEMTIFSSPGWSETGGSWVKPEQAMKKIVTSETVVEGPRKFSGKLAQPPSNNGPIRNLRAGGGRGGAAPDPTYYGDSAVIAWRTPEEETRMADANPKATTNAGPIDAQALIDDDLNTNVTIAAPQGGGAAWLQYEFAQPFAARAISLGGRGIPVGRVMASDDGRNFRTLATLPGPQGYHGAQARTFAFPLVKARFYRVELTGAPLTPAAVIASGPVMPAQQFVLSEAILYSGARVHRWEDKGAFGSLMDEYESSPTPAAPADAAVDRGSVVNLTSKMQADGTLDWDVPAGKWTILRFGYSLTGAKNRPAVAAALGYEADKLSRENMTAYYHGYFDPLEKTLGPLMGGSLKYVLIDSWEAGMQNWTKEMIPEFQKRRGYDPTPYLGVLAGHVVGSAEISDRLLWDFRRTLADMFAEYHYGTLAELLGKKGIGTYSEASGVALEIPEDTLLNKSKVEIPMGEFWVRALHPESMYYVDVRGAASAAHVYGKKLVATESFTGGGYEAPATLKRIGDYWFAQGVNRLVFHTSAHQPLDSKPGNTMVGTHINRNITWAEQAAPLMTYLSRNSYMLQQGLFVADLAYLLREGAPSTMPFWGKGLQPAPPEGYDYDYINTDVLLNRMTVASDGRLVLPDGMSYRVLVLPEIDRTTPRVARKIRELIAGGATVVGPKPALSPSLADAPNADREVAEIGSEVWGDLDGITATQGVYGKGRVVWGAPLAGVLAALKTPKDVEYSAVLDGGLSWIHRRAGDAEIYFVANGADRAVDIDARFRVSGKEAELWRPMTGEIAPAAYTIGDGRTTVPLHLTEREAVFVVFRHAAPQQTRTANPPVTKVVATVAGAWNVAFPPHWGAPEKMPPMAKLESWTASPDEGVKYFSGTAVYTKSIEAPAAWFRPGAKLLLDLGRVKDLAEVTLNGKPLGVLWTAPYCVDVTGVLKAGANRLEVKVTNEWTSRQIGDRVAPEAKRVLPPVPAPPVRGGGAFGTGPREPLESGLLGPVRVLSSTAR